MKNFLSFITFDIKRIIKNPIIYLGTIITFFVIFFNTGVSVPETQSEYEEQMGYLSYEEFQSLNKETFIQEQTGGGNAIPVYEDYMSQDERIELEGYYGEYSSTLDYSSLEEALISLDEEGSIIYYGMYDADELAMIDSGTYEKIIHSLFLPYAHSTSLSIYGVSEDGAYYEVNLPPDQAMEEGEKRAEVENYSAVYARTIIRISMTFMTIVSVLLIIQLCGDDITPKRITFFRSTNVNAWRYCLSKIMVVTIASFIGVFISTFFTFLYQYKKYQDLIWGFTFTDYFFYLIVISLVSLIFISCFTMLILYLSKNQLITILVAFIVILIGVKPGAHNNVDVPYGMKLYRFVPSVANFWGIDVRGLYLVHQLLYLLVSAGLIIYCKMRFSRLIKFWG